MALVLSISALISAPMRMTVIASHSQKMKACSVAMGPLVRFVLASPLPPAQMASGRPKDGSGSVQGGAQGGGAPSCPVRRIDLSAGDGEGVRTQPVADCGSALGGLRYSTRQDVGDCHGETSHAGGSRNQVRRYL